MVDGIQWKFDSNHLSIKEVFWDSSNQKLDLSIKWYMIPFTQSITNKQELVELVNALANDP